jgi:beta-galactosidase/beta-glucuronidase
MPMTNHPIAEQPKADGQPIRDGRNPLPRSIARPVGHLLLDGAWSFALDLEDRGLGERWYLGRAYAETARWPGTIEARMAQGHAAHVQPTPGPDEVVAWYERTFAVPDAWRDDASSLLQLTFGACGYETRVWLNGRPLRTIDGEDPHTGEYTSFSYELPRDGLRGDGRERLTVRVADSLDADIPRGKQESRVYKRGGIWYQATSGPVRSVWLESVGRNRLRSRLDIISTVEDRLVEFVLTTRIHDPGDYRLRLTVTTPDATATLGAGEYPLRLEAGERRQRAVLALPDARLWAPEDPALYHLTAELLGPDGVASRIATAFGLRKIEARGRRVYLNNAPRYLDGILYQPGGATYEEIRRHLLGIKALGCNLARIHIAGIDPRIYDLADEIGLLLWVEVPSPHQPGARSRANHRAELRRLLLTASAHPSIVICSLYNEDWGAQDIATSRETRDYIAETFAALRLAVPQFLIVDNDGWRHISTEGRLESHLLTAHLYTPELGQWRELLERLASGQMDGVAAEPLVVGDPFFYRGQVPLVVSEWGGFGFAAYGGPDDSGDRAERIRAFKRALRQRAIAGDVYTQATSIEDEVNGLLDPHTGVPQVPTGLLGSAELA